jgi:hypothetical protein
MSLYSLRLFFSIHGAGGPRSADTRPDARQRQLRRILFCASAFLSRHEASGGRSPWPRNGGGTNCPARMQREESAIRWACLARGDAERSAHCTGYLRDRRCAVWFPVSSHQLRCLSCDGRRRATGASTYCISFRFIIHFYPSDDPLTSLAFLYSVFTHTGSS